MKIALEEMAAAIRTERQQKGLSQKRLGTLVGLPQSHISRIERGEIDLQTSTLISISRALELELVLVPRKLTPTLKLLLSDEPQEQRPAYQLEDGDDET